MRRKRTFLVSVLDWGLGHATRTSALVWYLRRRGDEVVVAGSGRSLELLRRDHPTLRSVELKSFSPELSSGRSQWKKIAMQVPAFIASIIREHKALKQIVAENGIDVIISDNRYGLWSEERPSYLITHQLRPHIADGAPKLMEKALAWALGRWEKKFTACLIPDIAGEGLSGELSAPVAGVRARRIGLLSRIAVAEESEPMGEISRLGIASGPEPQRSIFIDILTKKFEKENGRRIILGAAPGEKEIRRIGGIEIWPHAEASEMKRMMKDADEIVCRSGYTTIMDLIAVGRKATLIATPGQAEQEYLAKRMKEKFGFNVEEQEI